MGTATLLIGSLGALIAALAGLLEAASRLSSRRVERRKAEAEAVDAELGNTQKMQAIWGEEFARLDKRIEELEGDIAAARAAWTEQRIDLQREVDGLRGAVDSLRAQVRDLDPQAQPVA